jgi:hypothetical protein
VPGGCVSLNLSDRRRLRGGSQHRQRPVRGR